MADREGPREMPSAEVTSRLTDSLKSCNKLVASYRQLIAKQSRPLWKGWKR